MTKDIRHMYTQTDITYAEAKAMLQSLLSDRTTDYFSDTDLEQWIMSAVHRLSMDLPQCFLSPLLNTADVSTIATVHTYVLTDLSPAPCRLCSIIHVNGGDYTPCKRTSQGQWERFHMDSGWDSQSKTPMFIPVGQTVYLECYATSSTVKYPAASWLFVYVQDPGFTWNDSSILPLPSYVVPMLLASAKVLGLQKGNMYEQAKVVEADYQAQLAQTYKMAVREGFGE